LFLCTCFLVPGLRSDAQTLSPTPEQLQIFQGLSPEQQSAILQQIAGAAGGTGTAGFPTSPLGQGAAQTERRQQLQGQLAPQRKPLEEEEEPEPVIPVIRAEDWVIIEIDYQLPPRPIPPYLQSLYSAQVTAAGALPGLPQAAAQAGAQAGAQNAQAPAVPGGALTGAAGQTPSTSTTPGSMAGTALMLSQLTDEEKERLEALMKLIRSKNPYQLSHDGALALPGFPPVELLGLTEEQATMRLRAEPAFRGIDIRLTRLPVKKTGVAGLKPFGYDLFARAPSSFAPVTDVPVPSDYTVGPGDVLNVQLYGTQNRNLKLVVGRDGHVNFPDLGPINVGGQTFDSVKSDIEARVQRQEIGVHASVSMGDTRSIRVFVLGEARNPGSFTISGLGTITSALYAAGGIKRVGSLRNIALKRRGALVRRLDLYDLLIRGDTTDDTKLLQGDVIFIPPVGPTVSVDGEVRRPAIYETRHESTVADVINLAGGLTPEADASKIMLTRIDEAQRRIVMPIDLSAGASREMIRNGDLLRVMRLRPTLDSGIVVQGHVYDPGAFAYRPGIRLSDVIHSVDELRPDPDLHYLLIRRELPPDRQVSVLSADLAAALSAPGSAADVLLMPRDRITVFDLASRRDHVIQPLMDELHQQGTAGKPTEIVHIDGQVRVPGSYPLETGMRVSDLMRAGGGAADAAYGREAELTRYSVGDDGARRTELIKVNLAGAMRGDPAANVQLQAFDTLTVKEVPLWGQEESIVLKGEFRFPGTYAIRRGETLKSVIQRAGGLTTYAFPEGSVFTREGLRKREQEQMDLLAERIQRDLTILALQTAATVPTGGGAAAISIGQTLLTQLRTTRAVGRLVIDLPHIMQSPTGSAADVVLRGGDQLIVPRFQQQVTVLGEVQNSTSLLYDPHLSRDAYISQSGGTTRRADRDRIYVVRANGSVVAQEGSRWFEHGGTTIKPGDTIVVPLNAEHMPPLPFWQAVTQILYNVAIAVAAVHAL
jgi:protein involved in polysaccharide export with SLBB domain